MFCIYPEFSFISWKSCSGYLIYHTAQLEVVFVISGNFPFIFLSSLHTAFSKGLGSCFIKVTGCLYTRKRLKKEVKAVFTQETRVQPLGWEGPLEDGIATHSSILAWRIPWTEEPDRPWDHKQSDTTEAT